MAIEDLNGQPLKTEATTAADEAAMKKEMEGGVPLKISRLRQGQLMLAFMDTATKRLGAIGYMKQLQMKKAQMGEIGENPELTAMYNEVARLEAEVVGLVAEINHRFLAQDEARAKAEDVELYSDEQFFGRDMKQAEPGEA
jgi:hypothetical protein